MMCDQQRVVIIRHAHMQSVYFGRYKEFVMALPTTVHSGTTPIQWTFQDNYAQLNYNGPFKSSAGSIYGAFCHKDTTDDGPVICKATDPTSSFTADIDSANITLTTDPVTLWVYQDGDLLHIALASGTYYYYQFNMATDSMDVDQETIETVGGSKSCTIVARGAGDPIVVAYNGDRDKDMGASYERFDVARRSTAGSWTVGIEAFTRPDGDVDTILMGAVNGSDASVHLCASMSDNGSGIESIEARTFRNDNTFSTQRSVTPSTVPNSTARYLHGLSYHDGTRVQMRFFAVDNSTLPGFPVAFLGNETPRT